MGLEAQLRVLITSDGSSCRCDDGSGVILVGFWIILDPLYHYMDPLKFLQFEFAAVCCGWHCQGPKQSSCRRRLYILGAGTNLFEEEPLSRNDCCHGLLERVTESVANSFSFSTRQDSRTIVRQPGLHSALLSAWCTTQQQAPETISTRVLQEFYKASLAGDLPEHFLHCVGMRHPPSTDSTTRSRGKPSHLLNMLLTRAADNTGTLGQHTHNATQLDWATASW